MKMHLNYSSITKCKGNITSAFSCSFVSFSRQCELSLYRVIHDFKSVLQELTAVIPSKKYEGVSKSSQTGSLERKL